MVLCLLRDNMIPQKTAISVFINQPFMLKRCYRTTLLTRSISAGWSYQVVFTDWTDTSWYNKSVNNSMAMTDPRSICMETHNVFFTLLIRFGKSIQHDTRWIRNPFSAFIWKYNWVEFLVIGESREKWCMHFKNKIISCQATIAVSNIDICISHGEVINETALWQIA